MGLQQRQTLHRKQQESSCKTGTVSSLVPSEQQITEGGFGKLCRNQPESCQHINFMHRKCPTTNDSSNIPLFDRDRLDVNCHPCIPTYLLGKITEIENHYARIVTKFGEVQLLIPPTTLKPVECYKSYFLRFQRNFLYIQLVSRPFCKMSDFLSR